MARSKTSPSRRAIRLATTLVLALLTACAGSGLETTTTTVAAAITTTSGPGTTVSSTSTSQAGSSTSSTSDEEEIEIEDGQPQGGVRTIDVVQGDTVRFEVKSDAAYEIHIHGYDLMYDVEAGGRVQIEFEATVQGIFEIEIEDTSTQIAELVVS